MLFGIGLHVLIALYFAVHVIRTGKAMYWLMILFMFPGLGSVVYFFAIFLPNSRLERGAMKVVSAAAKAIDPNRELRESRLAFEETPTAQNQMRVAAALVASGSADEGARQYEACLDGPFANDPEIRYGAANAYVECARFADALRFLEPLQKERPEYRTAQVALLVARSLAGTGRGAEARTAFEAAEATYGSYEAKAEYAIWSHATGDRATAARLDAELDKLASRWNPVTREHNAHVLRRLAAARTQAAQQAVRN
jgi:hypothetical protein